MSKNIEIYGNEVNLQIWDTAGQERFHQGTLGSAFYRGAAGAMLVYDLTNDKSFEQLNLWRDEAISRLEPDTFFPIVVVGNKLDLCNDTNMCQLDVQEWCNNNGYGHIEASAKDGIGVQAAIEAIAALAVDAQRQNSNKKPNKCTNPNIHIINKNQNFRLDDLYVRDNNSSCIGGNC